MLGKNNIYEKRKKKGYVNYKYAIKRLSIGVVSVGVGAGLIFATGSTNQVLAAEGENPVGQVEATQVKEDEDTDKVPSESLQTEPSATQEEDDQEKLNDFSKDEEQKNEEHPEISEDSDKAKGVKEKSIESDEENKAQKELEATGENEDEKEKTEVNQKELGDSSNDAKTSNSPAKPNLDSEAQRENDNSGKANSMNKQKLDSEQSDNKQELEVNSVKADTAQEESEIMMFSMAGATTRSAPTNPYYEGLTFTDIDFVGDDRLNFKVTVNKDEVKTNKQYVIKPLHKVAKDSTSTEYRDVSWVQGNSRTDARKIEREGMEIGTFQNTDDATILIFMKI